MKLAFGLLLHLLLSISTCTLGKCHSFRQRKFYIYIFILVLRYPDADVSTTQLSPLCLSQGVQIQADPGVNSDGVVEVELDKVVSLVCEHVVKSEAGVELVWLRNGAAIQLKEGNTENRSVVCVTPIYDDNGATFTCHQRQNSTISSSVTLNVTCKSMKKNSIPRVFKTDYRQKVVVFFCFVQTTTGVPLSPRAYTKKKTESILVNRSFPDVSSVMFLLSPPAAHWIRGHHSGGRG